MPSIFIVELSAYMAPARIQGKKKECSLIEIGHTMGLLLANKAMPPSDRVRLSARIAALRYASGANSVIVHVWTSLVSCPRPLESPDPTTAKPKGEWCKTYRASTICTGRGVQIHQNVDGEAVIFGPGGRVLSWMMPLVNYKSLKPALVVRKAHSAKSDLRRCWLYDWWLSC